MNTDQEASTNGKSGPLESEHTAATYAQARSERSNFVTSPSSNPFLTGLTTTYLQRYPRYLDVFRKVQLNPSAVVPETTIRQVHALFSALQALVLDSRDWINKSASLPPFYVHWIEDGSALVEWIFPDFRIGFSLEPYPADSGWYLVSNERLREFSTSGALSPDDFDRVLTDLFEFALANS